MSDNRNDAATDRPRDASDLAAILDRPNFTGEPYSMDAQYVEIAALLAALDKASGESTNGLYTVDALRHHFRHLLAENERLHSDLRQANIDYLQVTNGGRDLSAYEQPPAATAADAATTKTPVNDLAVLHQIAEKESLGFMMRGYEFDGFNLGSFNYLCSLGLVERMHGSVDGTWFAIVTPAGLAELKDEQTIDTTTVAAPNEPGDTVESVLAFIEAHMGPDSPAIAIDARTGDAEEMTIREMRMRERLAALPQPPGAATVRLTKERYVLTATKDLQPNDRIGKYVSGKYKHFGIVRKVETLRSGQTCKLTYFAEMYQISKVYAADHMWLVEPAGGAR